jgi:hypothetical protein
VHVENPIERLDSAAGVVEEWLAKSEDQSENKLAYLRSLRAFNRVVSQNDLPEFYDPIESAAYKDNLDSYNFTSIHAFMTAADKRAKFDITSEGTSSSTQASPSSTRSSSSGSPASSPNACSARWSTQCCSSTSTRR